MRLGTEPLAGLAEGETLRSNLSQAQHSAWEAALPPTSCRKGTSKGLWERKEGTLTEQDPYTIRSALPPPLSNMSYPCPFPISTLSLKEKRTVPSGVPSLPPTQPLNCVVREESRCSWEATHLRNCCTEQAGLPPRATLRPRHLPPAGATADTGEEELQPSQAAAPGLTGLRSMASTPAGQGSTGWPGHQS